MMRVWHVRAVAVILSPLFAAALLSVGSAGGGGGSGPMSQAAAPASTPTPSQTSAPIPGTLALPPHGSGSFTSASPVGPDGTRSPGGAVRLDVRNESDQDTTVDFTGSLLTVTAPAGALVRFLSGCTGPLTNRSSCPATAPPLVVCQQGGSTATCVISFTTVPAAAGMTEAVSLTSGCNNVTLTWANGTATSAVAAAVTPAAALAAIWRFDNAAQRFTGFAPQFPEASDLAMVNRLDAVFVCMTRPGTLARPIL